VQKFAIRNLNQTKMSKNVFLKLREFIYEKSGIFFPEGKLYLLESRLSKRLIELEIDSFEQYLYHIRKQISPTEELAAIYNLITINETFFFRFEKQLDLFINKLLPEVREKKAAKHDRRINIWSSASSSGEELYTIAMLLKEKMAQKLFTTNLRLHGTDISARILKKAKLGQYGSNSFRSNMDNYYKTKYFTNEDGVFSVKDEIKRMVSFDYTNLNDVSAIRKQRSLDFLFCRNVLIYFDKEMKKRVIRAFYDILNHGGYLFLGEAESLHGISSAFKVVHFPGVFVYWKE